MSGLPPHPAPADPLEAQLWRAVSEYADLNECLPRLAALLGERFGVRLVMVRRLDESPPRLTTAATAEVQVGVPGPLEAGLGCTPVLPARTDLAQGVLLQLRSFLTQGLARPLAALTHEVAHDLLPMDAPTGAWVVPLVGMKSAAGVALLMVGTEVDEARRRALLELLVPPLEVAFKNDHHFHEVTRLREALRADRDALLSRLGRDDICEVVIGESGGLSRVMAAVEQVARTDAPVLVFGETGSGKEVIARAIHERSARAKGPVVRINCGAIPTELVDSELFGHERGSFTGAVSRRKGWFERADGGTLFLDEIGELPQAAQVRLLRVLQDGSLERVGGHDTIHVDVRIVAATHRDLSAMVAARLFREDLWYRLSVFPIRLPALRERYEDLPALATYFAERAGKRLGSGHLVPTASDVELLRTYSWPGNVRELAAVIERAAILGGGRRLAVAAALGTLSERPTSSPAAQTAPAPSVPRMRDEVSIGTLDDAMSAHIRRALSACRGRIEGPFGAARVLGINPHTLRARMRKLGITWAKFRDELT